MIFNDSLYTFRYFIPDCNPLKVPRMPRGYAEHSRKVDAWIKESTDGLNSDELINHFETKFNKLWELSRNTISEVTLFAILDRAVFMSSDTHKILLKIKLTPSGIQWDEFRKTSSDFKRHELILAFAKTMTEFITIASNITDGVLTDTLYKTLETTKRKKKKI